MTASPRVRLLAVSVRRGGDEHAARLAGPDAAARLPGLPGVLRAALDGAAEALAGTDRVALDLEVAGERFRVERGASSRLLRLAEEGEQVLAEGDAFVTDVLARLGGASEPLGRRVVARVADVASRLRQELTNEDAGAVHAHLAEDLEAACRALASRIRELLQRAQGMLQDATDDLAPGRDEPLTPEDLAALRDDVVSGLSAAAGRLDRLAGAVAEAGKLESKLAERKARMQEYLKAEQLSRKLERRKHLMDAQRERLRRARAAASLARPGGGASSTGVAPEKRRRERAERELDEARAELSRARSAFAEQDAREPERAALGAWIVRLGEMTEAVARLGEREEELRSAEERILAAEGREKAAEEARRGADAALRSALQALEALEASPEEAERAHDEATRAARLAEDVRRLATVRDLLRERAREVQLAKIAVERVEEELELAQREIEWNRSSTQPRPPSDLPSVPELEARRETLERDVHDASVSLQATRDELRQRTAALGTQAYLSPELLEAEAREMADRAARFGMSGRSRAQLGQEAQDLALAVSRLESEAESAGREIRELSLTRIRAREEIARLQAAVPQHLRSEESLQAALREARDEHRQRLEAWEAATSGARRAEERVREAEASLRAAREAEASASRRLIDLGSDLAPVRQAGFESWADVEEARLSDEEIASLEDEVKEHETLERLVEDGRRIGSDDAMLPRADPKQAELMHALLRHARELSESRRGRLAERLAAIDRVLDALDEAAAELEHVEQAAGLASEAGRRGGSFEDRVREALPARVLARAEARLAAWQLPVALRWGGEPGSPRPLVLAGNGAPPDPAMLDALALALAVEAALAGEPVGLDVLIVDGVTSLPPQGGESPRWLRA